MNKLKEIRNKLGVSKWRLAKESNLNWKTIHRIESQDRVPFESSKEKIAQALGVSVEEIFPSSDVKHIFIVEPRQVGFEKKKALGLSSDIVGFLLDRKFRRCTNVNVNLNEKRIKIASTTSEGDGRFVFKNIPAGDYVITSRKIKQEISI